MCATVHAWSHESLRSAAAWCDLFWPQHSAFVLLLETGQGIIKFEFGCLAACLLITLQKKMHGPLAALQQLLYVSTICLLVISSWWVS